MPDSDQNPIGMTGVGRRRRRAARALIAAAVFVMVLPLALFLAGPQTTGGMQRSSAIADIVSFLVIGCGVGGMLLGLAWIIRIYRADPEPDESSFRFRDF
jgi:NADH:ubiquinone oxidoreductase subunit K